MVPVRVADQDRVGARPRSGRAARRPGSVGRRRSSARSGTRETYGSTSTVVALVASAGSPPRRATRARARRAARAAPARASRSAVRSSGIGFVTLRRAVESYTAPWASPPALARLAAVEAALPSDPAAALERAAAAARAHARRLDEDCLQLYAGTNVPSPLVAALHEAALAAQPSMGYPGDEVPAGARADRRRRGHRRAASRALMGAAFAEVRPTSATLANLAVYTALTEPGRHDRGAARLGRRPPQPPRGGRARASAGCGSPRCPTTSSALDVDLDALDEFLGWEVPAAGRRRREPDALPAPAERDRRRRARARHPAALRRVARRRPGRRGPLPGPAARGRGPDHVLDLQVVRRPAGRRDRHQRRGAGRAGRRRRLSRRWSPTTTPRGSSRWPPPRSSASAQAAPTPTSASPTRRRWRAALATAGFDVLGAGRGFTASHHVAIDVAGGGTAAAIRLAEGNILTSEIGIPVDPAGGVRIGTQAITRQGFVEDGHAGDRGGVRRRAPARPRRARDVAELRRRHTGLRWCLTPEDL